MPLKEFIITLKIALCNHAVSQNSEDFLYLTVAYKMYLILVHTEDFFSVIPTQSTK